MTDVLIDNAEKQLKLALKYVNKAKEKNDKSELLLTNYYLGKYDAYIDMLKLVDLNSYNKLTKKNKRMWRKIMLTVEEVFVWG